MLDAQGIGSNRIAHPINIIHEKTDKNIKFPKNAKGDHLKERLQAKDNHKSALNKIILAKIF